MSGKIELLIIFFRNGYLVLGSTVFIVSIFVLPILRCFTQKNPYSLNLIIFKIIELIDPKLAVGSIGNSEDDFRTDLDLEYNLKYIENKKFDIDRGS